MITGIVSYDGNTFAPDYEVGFVPGSEPRLPPASMEMLERVGAWPVIVALQRKPQRLALVVRIVGTDRDTLRTQLFRWFDPEDETPKTLVGENHNGIEMSVEALCEELKVYGDQQHDTVFVATMVVDDDVRWRAAAGSPDAWNITATGQTHVVANSGEDEAYPILEIEPTNTKTGGYTYKRYVLVSWRGGAGSKYPVQIGPLDTAALVGAGKCQADGDDLRVFVDGLEVPRYFVDMNDANTYIWFIANWQQAPALELEVSIAAVGTVDSIALDDEVEMALLSASGAVRIDNEVFLYGSVDLVNKRLTDVERAVWGTSAGAHSAGATVYWMQHEIVLVYGNATATAPSAAWLAENEPVFVLASSDNTEWVYTGEFGETAYPNRPGRWRRWGNVTLSGNGGVYTGTGWDLNEPYTVIGAWMNENQGAAYGWALDNPCGIVNAAWGNGWKYARIKEDWLVHLMYWVRGASFWTYQATLTDPALDATWEVWTEAAAVADWDEADSLAIALYFYPSYVEAGEVTVSLSATDTPVTSIGSELGNYTLACTITNETTDEAITVDFEMALNETLEVNTDERTVTYGYDASNQYQAVDVDSARRRWLRLLPGNNTLRFDDTGTAAVTLTTTFQRRYY